MRECTGKKEKPMLTEMKTGNLKKRQKIRKGIVISTFLLFPVVIFYFSPYLIVIGATEGIIAGSFIMFSLQFILSLFSGRSICGYVCPVGGLQECLMLANGKKAKGGKRNFIKYCIWAPWIIAVVILFIRAGGFSKIDFFYHTANGVSLYEPFTYVIYYGVLLLVVVLSLTAGKRAFCHYVCWMSPFMVIGSKISDWLGIPKLRLKSNKDNCISCGRCSDKCPMSLDVREMVKDDRMKNTECILCGECIDTCPRKAITYTSQDK